MKNTILITHVDFWRRGAGHRSRISSLISYLSDKMNLTVVYLGIERKSDWSIITQDFENIELIFLDSKEHLTTKEYCAKFKGLISNRFFDLAIIEYIELSIFLEFFPPETITILDTHDMIHLKVQSFAQSGLPYHGIRLSKKDEFELYSFYNYILFIQEKEYHIALKELAKGKALLVPHAINVRRGPLNPRTQNIVFVGSEYEPNIQAIVWFLENVWGQIISTYTYLQLHIYGRVCQGIKNNKLANQKDIFLHGFVENINEIYLAADIAINPVFTGAGLKIKNVEAMSFGLPLITSSHGATGIQDGANSAFILANSPDEYYLAIKRLIDDEFWRNKISNEAGNYVERRFGPEKCYDPLFMLA